MNRIPRRFIHRTHPWLVIRNLFTKKDSKLIPEGYYCYERLSHVSADDIVVNGGKVRMCPYYEWYQSIRHGFSPEEGFGGCKYLNRYDDPCINDSVKICNENLGDDRSTDGLSE